MLIHSVFFYLKPDLSDEQRTAFRAGVETLIKIDDAEAVFVGTPAATAPRPVVDTTYDVGLTVVLKDVAAHDAYQDHPIHHAFVDHFKEYWERVQIYDAE
jgi:hypothetical protein